ncbi:MAG: TIGR02281 family clan AA aspartic protease [Pseudomonadota bacterium]
MRILSFFIVISVLFLSGFTTPEDAGESLKVAMLNSSDQDMTFQSKQTHLYIKPDRDGHFRTDARINGYDLKMLVDTGASMVALSRSDALKLGYVTADKDFDKFGKSATGKVKYIEITLPHVVIGDIVVHDVEAAIIDQTDMPPLLGMSFISKLNKMEISNNRLLFKQSRDI